MLYLNTSHSVVDSQIDYTISVKLLITIYEAGLQNYTEM